MYTQMLIAGELVGGEGEVETILDSATAAPIASVAGASAAQVEAAVAAAEKAFTGWARTPPRDRATLMLRIADRIEAEATEYAALESRNTGKPLSAVLNDELPGIADIFRYFAGVCRAPQGLAAGEYLAGHTSMIRRDPVGVVASIAPWNYPLMMLAWKIAPAIAAGNALVLKPSEQTPLTALKLGALLAEVAAAGCGQYHLRSRGTRRAAADQSSARAHGVTHRFHRHRTEDPGGGRRQPQAYASGTRGQGAGGGVR